MAATGATINYGFPTYNRNDVTSYQVTWNQAMAKIDETCKNISNGGNDVGQELEELRQTVDQIQQSITDLTTAVGNNTEAVNGYEGINYPVTRVSPTTTPSAGVFFTRNGKIGVVKINSSPTGSPTTVSIGGTSHNIVITVPGNIAKLTQANVTSRAANNMPSVMTNDYVVLLGTQYVNGIGLAYFYFFYDAVTNKTYFTQTNRWNSQDVWCINFTYLKTGAVISV